MTARLLAKHRGVALDSNLTNDRRITPISRLEVAYLDEI